jgi:putative tryptophan/tyrosine transport system substrate-binding protein
MRRRAFIAALGGAAAWPLMVRGQQQAMPVIGFLNTASSDTYAYSAQAFREGLRTLAYIEGKNVAIEYRWAGGDYNRMPALARELVNKNVDVIAATGDVVSARAAQAATTTIPIVFTIGADPVRFGLVRSLNRPGGNLTGMTLFSSTLMAKRMEILTQLIPDAYLIGLFMNPSNATAESDLRDAQEAAHALGRQTAVVNARSEGDFDSAFAAMMEQRIGAVLVASDPILLSECAAIAKLSARHALPVVHFAREFVVAGGLASYGTGVTWMYHQAGIYCGRILNGTKPADLPVEQPTKLMGSGIRMG